MTSPKPFLISFAVGVTTLGLIGFIVTIAFTAHTYIKLAQSLPREKRIGLVQEFGSTLQAADGARLRELAQLETRGTPESLQSKSAAPQTKLLSQNTETDSVNSDDLNLPHDNQRFIKSYLDRPILSNAVVSVRARLGWDMPAEILALTVAGRDDDDLTDDDRQAQDSAMESMLDKPKEFLPMVRDAIERVKKSSSAQTEYAQLLLLQESLQVAASTSTTPKSIITIPDDLETEAVGDGKAATRSSE